MLRIQILKITIMNLLNLYSIKIITSMVCLCFGFKSYSQAEKKSWLDEYTIGTNYSQWSNDEIEIGVQAELNKVLYTKNNLDIKGGIFLNIDYLPTPWFYNENSGKVKGIDLRMQLLQLSMGAEYNFSEHFSVEPKFLFGLSSIYTNGHYENQTINLSSPRVHEFYSYFTSNFGLDINYFFNEKSGISLSMLYPLTQKPTPKSIGLCYIRRLN